MAAVKETTPKAHKADIKKKADSTVVRVATPHPADERSNKKTGTGKYWKSRRERRASGRLIVAPVKLPSSYPECRVCEKRHRPDGRHHDA